MTLYTSNLPYLRSPLGTNRERPIVKSLHALVCASLNYFPHDIMYVVGSFIKYINLHNITSMPARVQCYIHACTCTMYKRRSEAPGSFMLIIFTSHFYSLLTQTQHFVADVWFFPVAGVQFAISKSYILHIKTIKGNHMTAF